MITIINLIWRTEIRNLFDPFRLTERLTGMLIFGFLDFWIFGFLDFWIFGYENETDGASRYSQ